MKHEYSHHRLINPSVKHHKWHFFLQCLLFAFVVLVILILLDQVLMHDILGVVGATSLTATAFIAFTLPESPVAKYRCILGSYIICLMVGIGSAYFAKYLSPTAGMDHYMLAHQLIGACGVGVAMFFMVLFDMEHPPAVGVTLGLIIEQWDFRTLLAIIVAIVLIVAIAWMLRNWLISLANKGS